jgi:hypothetical protein
MLSCPPQPKPQGQRKVFQTKNKNAGVAPARRHHPVRRSRGYQNNGLAATWAAMPLWRFVSFNNVSDSAAAETFCVLDAGPACSPHAVDLRRRWEFVDEFLARVPDRFPPLSARRAEKQPARAPTPGKTVQARDYPGRPSVHLLLKLIYQQTTRVPQVSAPEPLQAAPRIFARHSTHLCHGFCQNRWKLIMGQRRSHTLQFVLQPPDVVWAPATSIRQRLRMTSSRSTHKRAPRGALPGHRRGRFQAKLRTQFQAQLPALIQGGGDQ